MPSTLYPQGIIQYIPFFYVIWSDDLLSASEIAVVRHTIEEDPSLKAGDQAQLYDRLNPQDPPGDGEMTQLTQLLANSGAKPIDSDNYPLATFSGRLLEHSNGQLNEQLTHIEL